MQPAQGSTSTLTAQRVVPLLQAVSRLEDLVSSITIRLDPVTNHAPASPDVAQPSHTVTGRINNLGDTLQYLLDNIEL